MRGVEIRDVPVHGDTWERDAFEALPHEVYAGDPWWSPSSAQVAHACLEEAESDRIGMLPVVAVRGDRVLARAAAIIDPDESRGQGWVGLVECLPDEWRAGAGVIARSRGWLHARGVRGIVAPRATSLVAGLLVAGFDRPQTYLTPHNPAWYAELFRAVGFRTTTEMLALEFTRSQVPVFRDREMRGFHVRSANRLPEDLLTVNRFQDAVFRGRPGHRRRSTEQFERPVHALGPALDPDLVMIAEDTAGQAVGVLVCLVDAWQTDPPGGVPDRARLLSIAVADGWRGRGVALAMGRRIATVLLDKGYQTLEGSWVLRDNRPPQALALALGARVTRRFALLAPLPTTDPVQHE
jgi:GNAT superfamily N-acetyltransferase